MSLNFDVIGKEHGPFFLDYDYKKLSLYALSVGATLPHELQYIYEKEMKIIPTYWASILGFESFTDAYEYGQSIPHTLHFGFDIQFHQALTETSGRISYTIELLRIGDRGEGSGSLADIQAVAYNEKQEKIFTLLTRDIDLSTGGFGGDKPVLPRCEVPDTPPDFEVEDFLGPNQAALYRIDNDPNLLHIDPEFAKEGGFEEPIVMGMCTAGYACRAVVDCVCPNRPEAITDFRVRFTSALPLNQAIITQIWKVGEHRCFFRLIQKDTGTIILNFCEAQWK